MDNDKIRIGLARLGHRGVVWLRHLTAENGFRVTAVCDPIPSLHRSALARIPDSGVTAYRKYDDMLADDRVDAVALCVRSRNQGFLAAQALTADKHVNAEVPAAHSMEDCWRIVLATERTGLVYSHAEQTRYWGFVDAWHEMVSDGRLGHVTFCEGQYLGYYGTHQFFQDPATGEFCPVERRDQQSGSRPTWLNQMPPIHYLPHELSPMLKILDDRVVEVVAMSTDSPSKSHPEIEQPDIQVALMKTEKGAILRMAAGFTQQVCHERGHHWYQVMGTGGSIEWKRSARGKPLMWLADQQMHDMAEVDWGLERADAPDQAHGSGHGDADYYVHAAFRDVVTGQRQLDFDVYEAMETAAPAVLAADSIDQVSLPMRVPDFRPGKLRIIGQAPETFPDL